MRPARETHWTQYRFYDAIGNPIPLINKTEKELVGLVRDYMSSHVRLNITYYGIKYKELVNDYTAAFEITERRSNYMNDLKSIRISRRRKSGQGQPIH